MLKLLIVFILVSLHNPEGREIDVNLNEITSVHCKIPNVKNKLFDYGVNTVIGLTDGKSVAVRETCSEVRDIIQKATK
jgi:uncharacterized protein YlzI (FlbEa/FlbD family)